MVTDCQVIAVQLTEMNICREQVSFSAVVLNGCGHVGVGYCSFKMMLL